MEPIVEQDQEYIDVIKVEAVIHHHVDLFDELIVESNAHIAGVDRFL
jgi:hypothetical protein